jgi:hypothetical protein
MCTGSNEAQGLPAPRDVGKLSQNPSHRSLALSWVSGFLGAHGCPLQAPYVGMFLLGYSTEAFCQYPGTSDVTKGTSGH